MFYWLYLAFASTHYVPVLNLHTLYDQGARVFGSPHSVQSYERKIGLQALVRAEQRGNTGCRALRLPGFAAIRGRATTNF